MWTWAPSWVSSDIIAVRTAVQHTPSQWQAVDVYLLHMASTTVLDRGFSC